MYPRSQYKSGPYCIKLTINGNFAINSNYLQILDSDWLWSSVAMVVTTDSKIIIDGTFYEMGLLPLMYIIAFLHTCTFCAL